MKSKKAKAVPKLKLNLGCGFNHKDGYVNVDNFDTCNPDVLLNLENTPWNMWEDSSVDEVYMCHVLEHLGQHVTVYFQIIKELYRICKDGAVIEIIVPHWMHENFAHDPTHCRIVTPIGLAMFNQQRNLNDMANGGAESKLGLMLGVDFELTNVVYIPDGHWAAVSEQEGWSEQDIFQRMKDTPGVCQEMRMTLIALKPHQK